MSLPPKLSTVTALVAYIGLALFHAQCFAYRVDMSTFFATSNSAVFLNTWSNTAARSDVLNANHGAVYNPAEDPEIPDIPPTTAQWQTIFSVIRCVNDAEVEFARSQISRDPTVINALAYSSITNILAGDFSTASTYGYGLTRLMFYDNAVNGTNYNWTTTEVQYMRNWLDANGYTNVALGYDARNNGVGVRSWCTNSLVKFVLLESGASGWFSNLGQRQTLLPWLFTNPATANKDLIFQIVADGIPDAYGLTSNGTYPPAGYTNNFMYTRELIAWLGNTLMGYDFMRSSNVVFMPITYNSPKVQWSQEMTPDGGHYTNTMMSLTLSLIEQRAFFEGRMGTLPSQTNADSFIRNPYPAISYLANQTVAMNNSTTVLPIAVTGQGTAPANLTVSAYSSNPFLVVNTNIVIQTWSSTDLGSVGVAGSNTLGDVITMSASGADISSRTDAGRFIYQTLAADGAMVARVTDLQPVNAWSKAGVMMRASISTGSVNCFMHVTASNGVEFSWRSSNNGSTSSNVIAGVHAPCWVQLVKTGTNFAGYYALDNAGAPGTWTQVGTTVGISTMSSNLLSGLAGTSHNNTTNVIAIFDNISGNTNRTMVVTPSPNQAGTAVINLTVSDGYFSTNTVFTLTVPTSGGNTAPTISLATNAVTLYVSQSNTIAFTVGDAQTPAGSLGVAGNSENTNLVPNANLVFGGSGANRTVTITPVTNQTGMAIINLGVSDGTNSAGFTLFLTVLPARDIFPAATAGPIENTNTWGVPLPLPGDTNTWQTGNFTLNMLTSGEIFTFNGGTFDIQAGGAFIPGVPNATLILNNLVLDGGLIYMGNNLGLTMNLSGGKFTLNSGTLQGGIGSSMSVIFQNGALAGSGIINIAGKGSAGGSVQFQSTIKTTNFTGAFNVQSNGILYLPTITANNASFGLNLSGTGLYYNNTAVALNSLVISGTNYPPGTYTYSSFAPAQQAFIGNNGGTITVVNSAPVLTPLLDQEIIAGQTLTLANPATDPNVPPQTLTFSLLSLPAGMTINPSTGVLTWRPTIAQSSGIYLVTVKVADNGSPSLSNTNSYYVTVDPPANPIVSAINVSNRQISFSVNGDSGPDYVIQTSSNLTTWLPVWTNTAAVPPFVYTNNIANFAQRFYRVLLGP